MLWMKFEVDSTISQAIPVEYLLYHINNAALKVALEGIKFELLETIPMFKIYHVVYVVLLQLIVVVLQFFYCFVLRKWLKVRGK